MRNPVAVSTKRERTPGTTGASTYARDSPEFVIGRREQENEATSSLARQHESSAHA
jgi:hypothetical protein